MRKTKLFRAMLPAFAVALSIGSTQASDVSVNVAADSAFVVNVPASTTRLRIDNGSAVFQGSVYADNGSTLLGAGANYDNTTSKGFFSNSTNTASGSYSTAFGKQTTAIGGYGSFAVGNGSTASGYSSTAMGSYTTASGDYSVALGGYNTTASGRYSVAIGRGGSASGDFSVVLGGDDHNNPGNNWAAANYSLVAGGRQNYASNQHSTIIGGWNNTASGKYSTAINGFNNTASGYTSTAMGADNTASGNYSTASGYNTISACLGTTTIGHFNDNSSWTSCKSGINPVPIDGSPLFVIGNGTNTNARSNALVVYDNGTAVFQGSVYADDGATLLGAGGGGSSYDNTTSNGFFSNSTNVASGNYATAFGKSNTASGNYSTVSGQSNTASGTHSTAIGFGIGVSGNYSTAMGFAAVASGDKAVAMGRSTASGTYSVAGGNQSRAVGYASAAVGQVAKANGGASFATGYLSEANGQYSFAANRGKANGVSSSAFGFNITSDCFVQFTIGKLNDNSSFSCTGDDTTNTGSPLFVVGNGVNGAASNALVVFDNGNATLSGTLTQSSDRRLKQNIVPLAGSLDKVQQLRGVSYEWIDPNRQAGRQIGFIAQEVQEVIPEVVSQNGDYLAMSYANLTAVLVEAVKEQQIEIEAIQRENDVLEAENDALELENQNLEKRLEAIETLLKQAGLLR